jgi:hypothetical protein
LREEEAQASKESQPRETNSERPRFGICSSASDRATNKSETRRDRAVSLPERFLRVVYAWDDSQTSRSRDAIYVYLKAVYAVLYYDGRRRRTRLLRHLRKFGGQHLTTNADIFTIVIRSTSGGELNSKSISKIARAIRFVAHKKRPVRELISFMKRFGGINACAAKYASLRRAGRI